MTFFIDFFSCWTVFDKGCINQKETILQENRTQQEICKIFNDFVVREVKHIGDGNTEIKENILVSDQLPKN
jgi:hypothetical protein